MPNGDRLAQPDEVTAAAAPENIDQLRAENEHLVDAQRGWEAAKDDSDELFEASPIPSVVIDTAGLVRRSNRAAQPLLGPNSTGMALRARVEAADRRRFLDFVSECCRGDSHAADETCDCEVTIRAQTGQSVAMRLSARRLNAADRPTLITFTDLSERNAAIAESQRLQRNEAEARSATVARDQFMAMLSHELRTPLTPVMAAVSAALRSEDAPPHMRKMLGMIARNIEAERRLIDDLLDTSRIVHGKMSVERAPVDLHAIVEEALDQLGPELARKKLEVQVRLSADRLWVNGDAVRLRQVLWNLLQNAMKFSPEGAQIRVHSWNNQGRIIVDVTDAGIGMTPETITRLFKPFQQALDSQTEPKRTSRAGLGLGLAIARGIVELHGGEIHASSPGLGRGARFDVELATIDPPFAGESAAKEAPHVSARPLPRSRPKEGEPRILLVEDDADTAEALAELLRSEGFQIFVATSMAAALKQDVTEVDLVLSDIGLTDGTGLDLMRALRAKKDLPGIALSGYAGESDIRASQQAGFSAHLVKPISLDKLVAMIRRTGDEHPITGGC